MASFLAGALRVSLTRARAFVSPPRGRRPAAALELQAFCFLPGRAGLAFSCQLGGSRCLLARFTPMITIHHGMQSRQWSV
jgi:hypothetical protein